MVFDIKEEIATVEECDQIIGKIRDNINLNYPDISILIKQSIDSSENTPTKEPGILAGASLLPAILNLVNNAISATKANQSNKIELTSEVIGEQWSLSIRDFGSGFTQSTLE